MSLTDLKNKSTQELIDMAREMGIDNMARSRKQDIIFALLKRHAATPPHEPVALAVLADGDGGDGGVSGTRTAAPLTADALRWLLLNQRSRRQRLVAVARYVPPRGERESVLRVDWRTQLQGVELRSSRAALCDSRVPLLHRLATHHTGLLGCSRQEQHTPPAALRQALALCARLSALLLPVLSRPYEKLSVASFMSSSQRGS